MLATEAQAEFALVQAEFTRVLAELAQTVIVLVLEEGVKMVQLVMPAKFVGYRSQLPNHRPSHLLRLAKQVMSTLSLPYPISLQEELLQQALPLAAWEQLIAVAMVKLLEVL